MPDCLSSEQALARWLAHGVTSRTHPILERIFHSCFHPLGIEADWLEAEPFSSLELGNGWWLRRPRWNPARFNRRDPGAEDFGYLLDHPDEFSITADSQGQLSIGSVSTHVATANYLQSSGNGWAAIRHAVAASHYASVLIYAGAGLLLANDPIAGLYAQGDDDAFYANLRSRLEFPPVDEKERTAATGQAGSPSIGTSAMPGPP